MNVIQIRRLVRAALLLAVALAPALRAQATAPVTRLVAEPASVTVQAGQAAPVKITAYDAQGAVVENPMIRASGARGGIQLRGDHVKGIRAGSYQIVLSTVPADTSVAVVTIAVPVTVTWPPVSKVVLTADSGRLYVGVTLAHQAQALHPDGSVRPSGDLAWRWESSNEAVASVDRFGNVTGHSKGTATISATVEGVRESKTYTVVANPVATLTIQLAQTSLRTGDVVHLSARATRANGTVVPDVPISWSYLYTPDDTVAAPGATGVIDRGLFTAEVPGRYTLLASAGNVSARQVVEVRPRDARRKIQVAGHGSITNVHTSDFWPWTGKDGRDYALVGTWGGDGWAYVMDITDMAAPVKTDSIKVDARVINDVTVSPDGRYGVLAREGASNRVNGVVLLDLAIPAHPRVASSFSDHLTGGVHNTFATNDYLFAISGGDKYVIVDVRDIYEPKFVSEYDHPDSRVHDVWVRDGIAYSSEWGTGVVAVDVGNGKYGGTIQQPVLIGTFKTTSGATHEIYPYVQASTGKTYLFLGDEIMSREGRAWEGTAYLQNINAKGGPPQTSAGYTHIIDFTDPQHPKDIAKYHQEEFGSHDIIVEDDVMYQAYYDGGLRVVDVSGELVGNLAEQRREIAVYKPFDPNGYTANASFVMNAMPWKGYILFTDFNSGLWAAKLEPRPVTP